MTKTSKVLTPFGLDTLHRSTIFLLFFCHIDVIDISSNSEFLKYVRFSNNFQLKYGKIEYFFFLLSSFKIIFEAFRHPFCSSRNHMTYIIIKLTTYRLYYYYIYILPILVIGKIFKKKFN